MTNKAIQRLIILSKKKLATRIRELRGEDSQPTFAEKCNVSVRCIAGIEAGENTATLRTLILIAKGLEITVSELLKEC